MPSQHTRLVSGFSEMLRARNKQPATIESYRRDALDFLQFIDQINLNIHAVEPQTLLWFRNHLSASTGQRENSVRRKVIGVRQFFRFLAEEKMISNSPFDLMPIPERDDSLQKSLTFQQFDDLLNHIPESGFKNLRDRALLSLLAYEGLKATEIIGLQWQDLISSINLRTLTVSGPKSRTICLQDRTFESLACYVRAFASWQNQQEINSSLAFRWIFVAFKGKDLPLTLPHLTRHGLKFMLNELGQKSGIKHLHTESLRHHAISFQLSLGHGPDAIMQHLGLRRLGNVGKHLARLRGEA